MEYNPLRKSIQEVKGAANKELLKNFDLIGTLTGTDTVADTFELTITDFANKPNDFAFVKRGTELGGFGRMVQGQKIQQRPTILFDSVAIMFDNSVANVYKIRYVYSSYASNKEVDVYRRKGV